MATNLHKRFATDDKLEREGVWVDIQDGVQFKILSDNIASIRELRHQLVWVKYRVHYSRMDVPPHIEDAVNIELASAMVADWRGVMNEKGEAIPFSTAAVKELLTELRDLRANVLFLGGASETFRKQRIEDIAGNSGKP